MEASDSTRRSFGKLTLAAAGGLVAGAATTAQAQRYDEGAKKKDFPVDAELLTKEPHVCKGLNTCKGHGASKDNSCGGQGACSIVAKHSCKGSNECKGQGGCGVYPGQNTCKGKGYCAVPLNKDAWKLARKQFEQLMGDLKIKIGKAPA